MAFDIQDTTYSGEYSSRFITKAMFAMDTIQNKVVHVEGDIKKQFTIGRIDVDKVLVPNAATPVDDGGSPIIIDGRQLIPKNADVYIEYNPRDLESNQVAPYLSTTILDRKVPQTLESQITQMVLDRAGESYETCMWQGSTAYAGGATNRSDAKYQLQWFNGYIQRMVNDAAINLSSISPVAITASNVLLIFQDLKSQCAIKKKALMAKKERKLMKYLISVNTSAIYLDAVTTGTTFKGQDYTSGQIMPWQGFDVTPLAGMPDNTVIFCRATSGPESNLWAGMNSMSDWKLKIQKLQNNSELFFVQAKFKWDVQYGWSDEIFMYTTLTAASFLP